jgi:hypothetical protein
VDEKHRRRRPEQQAIVAGQSSNVDREHIPKDANKVHPSARKRENKPQAAVARRDRGSAGDVEEGPVDTRFGFTASTPSSQARAAAAEVNEPPRRGAGDHAVSDTNTGSHLEEKEQPWKHCRHRHRADERRPCPHLQS